jgi:protein-disulfide isomerase
MTQMIHLSRRGLLASVAAAAMLPAAAYAQDAPDLSKLLEPPAHGEMPEGPETAKVTVIEYASASCPHCAHFFETVYPALKKDYIDTGKIRFLLREFPHNDAGLGGFMVARCAPPDKYLAILGVLFKTQDKWVSKPFEGLKEIALQAGFTEESFVACTKNADVAKAILAERKRADGFGVTGIPYIFINGKHYEGENTIEGLKAVIDPLLG